MDNYEFEDIKSSLEFYVVAFLILTALLFCASAVRAETINVEKLADAIYKAEGGNKTRFPYGIKSINTKGDKEYARKICLNSIRNQIKRHNKHICNLDFISCLGTRYCPTTIKAEYNLNKNWVKNVSYWYKN